LEYSNGARPKKTGVTLLEEFDDTCVRFDTVECDGQPDRWTEGRIFHDNIALWMIMGMLTRER